MHFRDKSTRRTAILCALYLLSGLLFIAAGEAVITSITHRDPVALPVLAIPGWLFITASLPMLLAGARSIRHASFVERRRYEALVQHSLDGLLLTGPDGRILSANPAACLILGFSEAELQRGGRASVVDASDPEVRAFLESRRQHGHARGELWAKRRDGTRIRIDVSSAIFRDSTDTLTSMSFRDVTEQVTQRYRDHLASVVFENSSECIGVLDHHWRILWANPAFERVTGFSVDEVTGRTAPFYELLRADVNRLNAFQRSIASSGRWVGEVSSRRANGELYPLTGTITRVVNEARGDVRYVATFTDASWLEEYERRLSQASRYDQTTGLLNRRAFEEEAEEALARTDPKDEFVALYLLNIDHFKHVNESVGHTGGDACLGEVARRLLASADDGWVVARHGGDSFFIMAPRLRAEADIAIIARRLRNTFDDAVSVDGTRIGLTAAIGISVFPTDGVTIDALMRTSESALAAARAAGGDDFRYHQEGAEARAREFVAKSAEIREGLRRGEFVPYFQPIVEASTERTVKLEVLARWHHPTRDLVGPGEFIGIAERSGLIAELSDSLLRQAVNQVARLRECGIGVLPITFNLSARQLRERDVVKRLRAVVHEGGLTPEHVIFEITETVIMDEPESKREILDALQHVGFRIFLDDFGTGYSSLNHLRHYKVDGLKIERSFIVRLPHDPTDTAIVRAMLAVAEELNLTVVAEGIEAERQAAYLREHGCKHFQGYLYARPMPGEALGPFLQDQG